MFWIFANLWRIDLLFSFCNSTTPLMESWFLKLIRHLFAPLYFPSVSGQSACANPIHRRPSRKKGSSSSFPNPDIPRPSIDSIDCAHFVGIDLLTPRPRMLPSYSSAGSKMMARHHQSSSPGLSNGHPRGNTFDISPHRLRSLTLPFLDAIPSNMMIPDQVSTSCFDTRLSPKKELPHKTWNSRRYHGAVWLFCMAW